MDLSALPWLDKWVSRPGAGADPSALPRIRDASLSMAPVIWLLGKTGSGKTSIIAELTGQSDAEIGNGYASCTRTARIYDFPSDEPLLRFLDTRGLGEAGYDPADDMSVNAARAHLVIATMRVSDMNQQELLRALRQIRHAHPDWPIVIAQTCLHERYEGSGVDHPAPYLDFADPSAVLEPAYRAVRTALLHQRSLVGSLKGAEPYFASIDFTRPEDGFTPSDYGRDALIRAIVEAAPIAVKELARDHFEQKHRSSTQQLAAEVNRSLLHYAAASAGAGAIPLVGLLTVPAVNSAMLWSLARRYQVEWDTASITSLIGMLGTAVVLREGAMFGLRQFGKIAPWIIPIAAVQDYAVTYALGRAACVFMEARRNHVEVEADQVRTAFRQGLKKAFEIRGSVGKA